MDYSACENILDEDDKESSPHYIIFIESEKTIGRDEKLDEVLQDNHPVYKSFRVKGSIGGMRVVQVKLGTFGKLKTWMLETTDASSNQIKIPRVLKKREAVKLLLENRI